MITRHRPEVLAPAGDQESLRAAIRAGADAVYFGIQGFNARARATNFDAAALGETLATLHEHGVKGYVTLNTLVFDAELERLEEAVRACAAAGVDAVIVQDLGVAKLVRAIAPSMPIHASTQMTCTDAAAVELAKDAGATRVILARELSLADIRAIRARTDMELEVFVHGALCIAYSGQCLTSEAIGGRSANRGACAQACRLPYTLVVDGVVRDLGERAYLLSPEDLEATHAIPELIAMGVASVKIEGRLKGPAYVAATTELYRRAIDAALGEDGADEEHEARRSAALQMFSRGSGPGFFDGIDHQRLVEGRACDHRGVEVATFEEVLRDRGRKLLAMAATLPIARGDGILVEGGYASEGEVGGRVWGITVDGRDVERAEAGQRALVWLGPDKSVGELPRGRRVWKTNDPAQDRAVAARTESSPFRVRLDVKVSGVFGVPPVFEAKSARGDVARVVGDTPLEPARSVPLTAQAIRDKLDRLGDTPFVLGDLTLDLPEGAMLPVSSLNRARRALTAQLASSARRVHATTEATWRDLLARATPPDRAPPPAGLFVLCRNLEQATAAVDAGADGVYLDFLELTGTGAAFRALKGRTSIGLTPPRIRKPGEEKIDKYLLDLGPDAILVRGLGALHEGEKDGVPRIGDFSLNVTNRIAACEVLSRGLVAFTPSFDLDVMQLTELLASPFGAFAEVVVHHPMPLFHMEHCVFAALLSEGKDHRTCGRPCDRHALSLRDRAGMDHPVVADVGCRNTVFHAASQSAAGAVPTLLKTGVKRFRIELVREGADEVVRTVTAYRELLAGKADPTDVWRGLRAEGTYGVVRGSLRILGA